MMIEWPWAIFQFQFFSATVWAVRVVMPLSDSGRKFTVCLCCYKLSSFLAHRCHAELCAFSFCLNGGCGSLDFFFFFRWQ